MKKENIELKVVRNEEETKTKLNIDAIEKLEKEVVKLGKELDNKEYLITKDKTVGFSILDFVEKSASWRNNESLGVIELSKKIREYVDGKINVLSLDAIGLQALYFFLGKQEGKGLESAIVFRNLLKPVSEAVGRMNEDAKTYKELEYRLISLKEGINPDKPEEAFKENEPLLKK